MKISISLIQRRQFQYLRLAEQLPAESDARRRTVDEARGQHDAGVAREVGAQQVAAFPGRGEEYIHLPERLPGLLY